MNSARSRSETEIKTSLAVSAEPLHDSERGRSGDAGVAGVAGVAGGETRRPLDSEAVPGGSSPAQQSAFTALPRSLHLCPDLAAAIITSCDEAMIGCDKGGRITAWNPAAERMYGFTAADIIGQELVTIVPQELKEAHTCYLQAVLDEGTVRRSRTTHFQKNGERIGVALTISPMLDAQGQVTGAAVVAHDDKQRRLVEDTLRNLNDQLHSANWELHRLAARANALADIADKLTGPETQTEEVLLTVARHVGEIVGGGCIVWLTAADGATLEPAAVWHENPERRTRMEADANDDPSYGQSSTALALIVEGGELEFVPGVVSNQIEPGDQVSTGTPGAPDEYTIIVPLQARGETIGVITIVRDQPDGPYSDADYAFVAEIASRTALAISNARLNQALAESAAVVEASDDAILRLAVDGRILAWNPGAQRLLGWSEADVLGRNITELAAIGSQRSPLPIDLVVSTGTRVRHETIWTRRDQAQFWAAVSLSPLRGSTGEIEALVAIASDVTDRKRTEEELAYLAKHDHLTGLANRARFETTFECAIERAKYSGNSVGLLFLDLDGFKSVNDTYGHQVGDELLRLAARRISHCVGKSHLVSRVGGDEFTVLFEDSPGPEVVRMAAANIDSALRHPFEVQGGHVQRSASIGIACWPHDGRTMDALMTHADAQMYKAKRTNGQANSAASAEEPSTTPLG